MKPYGRPSRKKLGCCGPHDSFTCWCDTISKSKERSDARREIEREVRTRADYDNSASNGS